jgi:hypothetical protein
MNEDKEKVFEQWLENTEETVAAFLSAFQR